MVKFLNDRMSFMLLRGPYDVIFLDVHVSTVDKSDETEDRFMRNYSMSLTHYLSTT
jgi:hypothetical protein